MSDIRTRYESSLKEAEEALAHHTGAANQNLAALESELRRTTAENAHLKDILEQKEAAPQQAIDAMGKMQVRPITRSLVRTQTPPAILSFRRISPVSWNLQHFSLTHSPIDILACCVVSCRHTQPP
jgi:hypothetical protein